MKHGNHALTGVLEPQVKRSSLEATHRELDDRLRELGRRAYLTPSEQMEMTNIKKRKLRAKDEIAMLR